MLAALGLVWAIATVCVSVAYADKAATDKASPTATKKVKKRNSAIVPVPRPKRQNWLARHAEFNERAKQGNVDLLFVGDSITENWNDDGKDVWKKYYGNRKAFNIGFSGDRTQHILWRLDHGNVDGIMPKLAVLMIGTNNYNDNSIKEIADGIKAVVQKLRDKLPETKVLVMGIIPRDDHREETRDKYAKINEIVAKLADDKTVYFMDISDKYLEPDGSVSKTAIPDLVHPGAEGLEIWAEAIEPLVIKFVGTK